MYYTYAMRFTWDPRKATTNARKHRVSFAEAVTVFANSLAHVVVDEAFPERSLIIGESGAGRVLVTVFVEDEEGNVRIISSRLATRGERRKYEQGEEK